MPRVYTERRIILTCNQNIKEDIPTVLEVFLCFETKRHKQIIHGNIHATPERYPRKNWVQCLKITYEGLP